jgi:glycosyltransferase involved in cell wall biosynthesis
LRIGVYNRHWATGGGGERYAAAIAEALVADHHVDLLSHDPVDLDWLCERLHLDLAGVGRHVLPDRNGSLPGVSRDYDLLLNASYLSSDANRAARGIYVVHFPGSPASRGMVWRHRAAEVVRPLVERPSVRVTWGPGFHPRTRGPFEASWTGGDASLFVTAPPEATVPLELVFAHYRPRTLGPIDVRVYVGGELAAEQTLRTVGPRLRGRPGTSVRIPVRPEPGNGSVEVRIVSDTFRPSDVVGNGDARILGVPLASVRIGGPAGWVRRPVGGSPPLPPPNAFLSTYDAVLANSGFTREWVSRRWGLDSAVLHPPTRPGCPGPKGPAIVAVGRFFSPERGHSKKQLEMVRAFRTLSERGPRGWVLHLVGGCKPEDRPYLDDVRRAAAGLPVEIHVDASGAELEALFAEASLFWLATGLDESVEHHPERFEHFGIATVEAMSFGVVPIVVGEAGPREVVTDGVDGFHFHTTGELVARSEQLVADDGLRGRLAAAARRRSAAFSSETFGGRVRAIVEQVAARPADRSEE